MKAFHVFMGAFVIVIALSTLGGRALALDEPQEYTSSIFAVDFYPSGAKFTFMAEPYDNDGNFRAIIPGAFRTDSIRLANPENVYGDIMATRRIRTQWTPKQLQGLREELNAQNKIVNELLAKKSSLEQTLALLKNSNPDKSNPESLLKFIKDAQVVRLLTETSLAELKVTLSKEQDKQRLLVSEINAKSPQSSTSYTEVTGQAGGTVYIEAFTDAAGWRPKYTLDLSSVSGSVEVNMFIRASQRTGLDYTGNMTLHTKTPDEAITTPEIKPLKAAIKPKQEVIASNSMVRYSRTNKQFASARAAMTEADTYMAEDAIEEESAMGAAPEAPKAPAVRETLSDRTLQIEGLLPGDGTEREYEVIMSDLYLDSKIQLVIVPELRNDAWIIASMDEKNEHLIPGEAELRVDHHPGGRIYLEEYGRGQRVIPFGYASQITAKKTALTEKTGVSWFSGVYSGGYMIEITNGTKDEQTITVKDRMPIPTDDKIKLEVKNIEPREKTRDKDNLLTWEITVPAGATVPITVDYALSYPSGEEIEYR
ncbi:MAG: DUF4139 domain-containing protein [Synergistaceae bacterium]|nr:DUF4139 domain-containing protein [Synergistaceae bacterium]